jgi:hypothetical protein
MGGHGKPPKTHSYNAWDIGAKTGAEKRGRRHHAVVNDKTVQALSELARVETLEQFKKICIAQERRRERRGY